MTLHENAKFTCERLVQEYEENNRCSNECPFWDVMKSIKHSLEINAVSRADAER